MHEDGVAIWQRPGSKTHGFATCYTNTEEETAGLTKAGDWQPYTVTHDLLVTGQNPASSQVAAQALLKLLA